MPSTNDTVVVIVPGSFSPVFCYDLVVESLQKHTVEAVVVKTPSVGRRDPLPAATMSDDASAISAVTEQLAAEGKRILLVAHSYGGVPATESLKHQGPSKEATVGVRKLAYLSALAVPVGVSTIGFMGGLPGFLTVQGTYMDHDPEPNSKLTFSDLPAEEALAWAKKMPPHSLPSFEESLSYAGYNDVDVAYIVLENDMIIPPAGQEAMVQFLEQQGKAVDVYRLQSGHCPNASQPQQLADIIQEIVKKM